MSVRIELPALSCYTEIIIDVLYFKRMILMSNYISEEDECTAEEFLKFVEIETAREGYENNRYELIDGRIYMMSAPSGNHMCLAKYIYDIFMQYFTGKECDVYFAPFDVFLFEKSLFTVRKRKRPSARKNKCRDVTQPDLFVLCEREKIKENGIHGAPSLVVEIVSKSSVDMDYIKKLYTYMQFGVQEYWIVDPLLKKITMYVAAQAAGNESLLMSGNTFAETVESKIFQSLRVDFSDYIWVD